MSGNVTSSRDVWQTLCRSLIERVESGQALATGRGGGVTAQLEKADDSEIVLLASLPNGNLQRVGVLFLPLDEDEAWVAFRTPVCLDHELDPRTAVTLNARYVFGHLELREDNGKYWFRHALCIDDILQPQHFAHFIAQFAGVADSLEHNISGQDRW